MKLKRIETETTPKSPGQTKAQVSAQAVIEHLAEVVGVRHALEIVEVELKGAGKNQLLRITIDKLGGVTHTDCETVSREIGEALDAEDPITGPYQLEVTSPGVERKLKKWQDWERFLGKKARVVLREPVGDYKHFDGVIAATGKAGDARTITVQLADGAEIAFPFDRVDRANLRFEW